MNVRDRNNLVYEYVSQSLEKAKQEPVLETNFSNELNALIDSFVMIEKKGFREVVLTAIAARQIDSTFKATENFYKCNPRSLYEGAIRQALEEYKIPYGKSGPLNVAKNADGLNLSWAKGKRPESAAFGVVAFLEILEREPVDQNVIDLFFTKMIKVALRVESVIIAIPQNENSKLAIAEKISSFVIACPEGGAVPQFIFGKVLECLRNGETEICGVNESVFGTNTTSRKPGDIWEEIEGEVVSIYEVTVKAIDNNRLKDCAQNVHNLGHENITVTFVCRIPVDTESIGILREESLSAYNLNFEFLDIKSFIKYNILSMTDSMISVMLGEIKLFIEDYNRPLSTKAVWNGLFEP